MPGPVTSPYSPLTTAPMPDALATMSVVVLSEKQECSSSWLRSSYATDMRSPASSPLLSSPMPVMIMPSASSGSRATNSAR